MLSVSIYKNKYLYVILLLGIVNSLPNTICHKALIPWLLELGHTKTTIAFIFSFSYLPKSLSIFLAPLVHFSLPFFSTIGHRKKWLFLTLSTSILCLTIIIYFNKYIPAILIASFVICTTQVLFNLSLLSYQTSVLSQKMYGASEAMSILGYRIGLFLGFSGILYLAYFLSWKWALIAVIILLIFTLLFIIKINEPINEVFTYKSKDYFKNILNSIKLLFTDYHFLLSILLMLTCKINDFFIGPMRYCYYDNLGFDKLQIANIYTLFGLPMTILGGILSGLFLHRYSINYCLLIFMLAHGVSLGLNTLLLQNTSLITLSLIVFSDHLTSGMRTTAILCYQLQIAKKQYFALNIALLNTCLYLGLPFLSLCSGYFINIYGWNSFFLTAALLTIPSIYIAKILLYNEYKITTK